MANSTSFLHDLPPLPSYQMHPLPPLIPGIPDQYLALALPVIAYWAVSMFFHAIDTWDLFPQYRLHTPAEVLKRNPVSRKDVFKDVIIQQVVQTIVGTTLAVFDEAPMYGREEYDIAVWARRLRIAQRALPAVLGLVGVDALSLSKRLGPSHNMLAGAISGGLYPEATQTILLHGQPTVTSAFTAWELLTARAIYHLIIPAIQFIMGTIIIDTWQYFMHRAFHMNKYLYTKFHSRHHRLYVPYAYGALYNHPLEGLFMDTFGAGVAYLATFMSCRQTMIFFTACTVKTVDDHCGYKFPWDPLQHVTSNNAAYHDVHHQSFGIKTNFSQPWFTFWDSLLGTKWTGGDVSARYEKLRRAAQKKVDAEITSVTGSVAAESLQSTSYEPYASHPASSTARTAHIVAEPRIPAGKATVQAIASRQAVLDDKQGGISVLAAESAEEIAVQQRVSSKPRSRKRTTSSGFKGFADRVSESLQGKATGVLGVDHGRR